MPSAQNLVLLAQLQAATRPLARELAGLMLKQVRGISGMGSGGMLTVWVAGARGWTEVCAGRPSSHLLDGCVPVHWRLIEYNHLQSRACVTEAKSRPSVYFLQLETHCYSLLLRLHSSKGNS